jgi:hypothetical protein
MTMRELKNGKSNTLDKLTAGELTLDALDLVNGGGEGMLEAAAAGALAGALTGAGGGVVGAGIGAVIGAAVTAYSYHVANTVMRS